MSTCTRVLCYRWNHYGGTLKWNSASRPNGLAILTLPLVQPFKRSSNILTDGTFLVHFQSISQVMVLHNYTAGRCCLYRAMLRNELPISCVKCTVVQGWVGNIIAIASRWPYMVPHRGARGRAISVYSTPWPCTCSGPLPSWCTIEVAALPAFTEKTAIYDAPGRLSHTCTCQRRGKHWDHSKDAEVSQQWYK